MAPDYSTWSHKRKVATSALASTVMYSVGTVGNYVASMYTGDDVISGSLLTTISIGIGAGDLMNKYDVLGKAGRSVKNMMRGYRQQ